MKPASGKEQQYKERDIKSAKKVLEKSVTTKDVSKSSTPEEDSKGVSVLKTATNSTRESVSAGKVEDNVDKDPTKTLRRRKEKTRPLASRKKIISAEKKERKPKNKTLRMRFVLGSSLKCSRTGPSLKAGMGIAESEEVKLVTEGLTKEFHEIKEFSRLGTLGELSRQETDMMTKELKVSGNIWELLWFIGNRDRYGDMVLSYEGNTVRCMSTTVTENELQTIQ